MNADLIMSRTPYPPSPSVELSFRVMAVGIVWGLISLSGCASIRDTASSSYVSRDTATSPSTDTSGKNDEDRDDLSPAATDDFQELIQVGSAETSPDSVFASEDFPTSITSIRPFTELQPDEMSQSKASQASFQHKDAWNPIGRRTTSTFDSPRFPTRAELDQPLDAFGKYGDTDGRLFDPDEPDGPDGPGGPPGGMGGQGDEPGYLATWYPSSSVSGQGTELGVIRQRVGIDIPVWFKGEDMVMASVSIKETHFSGGAILPDTKRAFPADLWDVQFGLKHMRQYSNGWTSMLMFDVGSASDKPFQAMRDLSFQLGGFVMIPAKNERDMWMLGAIYSPLGSPPFPIPLLSYHWKPSETFEMNIGLPSSMKWQATERLSLDLSYFPILSVDALATYKITDHFKAYGGYQNINDSWFLHDRVDRQDQFVALEQRLIVGLRRDLSDKFTLDLSAGYAFNRYFGEGNGMGATQSNLTDLVRLEPGAFLSGRVTWNF